MNTAEHTLNTGVVNTAQNVKSPYFKGFRGVFTSIFQFDNLTDGPEHIVHIDGVTGSSPVATTTGTLEKSRVPLLFGEL